MPVTRQYQQKIALGCTTTLVLATDLPKKDVDIIFAKLWLKIFNFEKKFSRFLQYSELSIFNNKAGNKVAISQEFEEILKKAKTMARATYSVYNPFILPSLHKVGYKNSFIDKHDDESIDYSHRSVTTINSLIVGNGFAEIPANTAIDLGGIGKGYLADLLSEYTALENLSGYWFSIGGDVVGKGFDVNDENWQVNIQNANSPKEVLDNIYTANGSKFAIATSGTITRKGVNSQNKNWHHIIDPITQQPSNSDVILATVVAKKACKADIFAKATVILGSRQSEQFLKDQGISSYIIQKSNKEPEVFGDFEYINNKSGKPNNRNMVGMK